MPHDDESKTYICTACDETNVSLSNRQKKRILLGETGRCEKCIERVFLSNAGSGKLSSSKNNDRNFMKDKQERNESLAKNKTTNAKRYPGIDSSFEYVEPIKNFDSDQASKKDKEEKDRSLNKKHSQKLQKTSECQLQNLSNQSTRRDEAIHNHECNFEKENKTKTGRKKEKKK